MNKRKIRKVILGLIVVLVVITIGCGVGCAGKPITETEASSVSVEEEPTPAQTEAEAETEVPIETEILTETSEEESELSVETPEAEFSSCVVLDEEYCKKGEVILLDEGGLILGFNLPEGSGIYSPFDGLLIIGEMVLEDGETMSKTIQIVMWPVPELEEVVHSFILSNIIPEEALRENEKVDFKWGEMAEDIVEGMIVVKKGEIVGKTKTGTVWNWKGKDYNFDIYIFSLQGLPPYREDYLSRFYVDMEFIREFFPDIQCE